VNQLAHEIDALAGEIQEQRGFIDRVLAEVGTVIVGQSGMIHRMLIALLADGHVLVEGVPGLAKTLAVQTLA
jgi:MoxR-like ATPase